MSSVSITLLGQMHISELIPAKEYPTNSIEEKRG